MIPHRLESVCVAERRCRYIFPREREQPLPLIVFAHESLKRLRQAVCGAALGDDVFGNELHDRVFGHPAHDGVHQFGRLASFPGL